MNVNTGDVSASMDLVQMPSGIKSCVDPAIILQLYKVRDSIIILSNMWTLYFGIFSSNDPFPPPLHTLSPLHLSNGTLSP